MEVLSSSRISKRSFILDSLDYYISESVYYRSFSEEIGSYEKIILFHAENSEGKAKIL